MTCWCEWGSKSVGHIVRNETKQNYLLSLLGVTGLIVTNFINPFTPKSDLIDFTLSNTRQFYSSKGDPLGVRGLINYLPEPFHSQE